MAEHTPEQTPVNQLHTDSAPQLPKGKRPRLLLFAAELFLVLFVTVLLLYRNVHVSVTAELGTGLPEASVFRKDGSAAGFANPPAISETEAGNYLLTLTGGLLPRKVLLKVRDTLPPEAESAEPVISVEDTLTPEQALSDLRDASAVFCVWEREPEFGSIGTCSTAVLLTDAYGNKTRVPVTLRIIEQAATLTIEAGSALPKPEDFLTVPEGTPSCPALEALDTTLPGTYDLQLEYAGQSFSAALVVEDTVPPAATPVSCETHCGYPLEPETFVTAVEDVTAVTVSFAEEPDWSSDGEITVPLLLSDAGGNVTPLEASCTLIRETVAPKLWGVTDRTCYVGEAVSYFSGIYVEDNYDAPEAITLEVDKSQVNTRQKGTYSVTFIATDRSGNRTEKSCKFTFIEQTVSEEELYALADSVLEKITDETMDLTDKAYAVFCYLYSHIRYQDIANSDFTDWKLAAWNGLTSGIGDCYNYYACSYLLLTRLDIPVVSVSHYRNGVHHFWLLVDLGTGWYHFDPTVFNKEKIPAYWTFMRTTRELKSMPSGYYYWYFDASRYPKVETEHFEYANRGRYVTAEKKKR